MMPQAVFLAGFMGSGKSTMGQALANRLGWHFIDLDDDIERLAGMAISRIFEDHGEAEFREQEHRALRTRARRASCGGTVVVALGGGTYAFGRNRRLMRSVGPAIWLDAPAEVLWDRVRRDSHRPLALDRTAFLSLHARRREAYARCDYRIDAAGGPPEVLGRILGLEQISRLVRDA